MNRQLRSIDTTLAVHVARPDEPLPITRECEKNKKTIISAKAGIHTSNNPIRRRIEMFIDVVPPSAFASGAFSSAERSVVYPSWPKLAISELLSTRGGHDGYATVGRLRQAQAGKGAARTVGFPISSIFTGGNGGNGERREDPFSVVVASRESFRHAAGLLRRCAPRNDRCSGPFTTDDADYTDQRMGKNGRSHS